MDSYNYHDRNQIRSNENKIVLRCHKTVKETEILKGILDEDPQSTEKLKVSMDEQCMISTNCMLKRWHKNNKPYNCVWTGI